LQSIFLNHPTERAASAYYIFLAYELVEGAGPHTVGERSRGGLHAFERRPIRLVKQAIGVRAFGLDRGLL
jgi:hypothetical protein